MKMKKIKKFFAFALVATITLTSVSCSAISTFFAEKSDLQSDLEIESSNQIKNVILMIGDGMGKNHIRVGEIYKGEKLHMQSLPFSVSVETCSADKEVTDSSAAATAMATGVRTNNSYVGITPNGEELTTIVDIATWLGKSTGILTTEELYGGTPMGFSGHNLYRRNYEDLIVNATLTGNVDLFAGYTCTDEYKNTFNLNGYTEISSVGEISESKEKKIFGFYPIKAEAKSMTAGESVAFDYLLTEALEYLSEDEDGFFLMAEGAHIDHGAENNNLWWMLKELLAFDNAVKVVLDWAANRDDTVVIVTADHESGALELKEGLTKENMFETDDLNVPIYYSWGVKGHSSADVACYIYGAEIDFTQYSFATSDRIKNIDIFKIMKYCLTGQ